MDELLGKQMPQSLEAEQAVLGAILIDSRCIADVIGILRPEDFYLEQNRQIYNAVYTMFNFSQTIDPVTVLDKMRELGVYQDNSRDYVMQLMEITPTAANVVRYARIVREKAMLRALARAAAEISDAAYAQEGTSEDILEMAEKKIYDLSKGERTETLEHIGTVLRRFFDQVAELSRSDALIPGLSTGFVDLDRRLNGLNKSDLIMIAARPSMGKTAFALNLAVNVAKKYNKTVAVFNLEMSREQLAKRLIASESFVELQKLSTGKLSDDEWTKFCMASSALSQTDIRIDDNPAATVADIKAKCRRLGDSLGLVIIDYLQLMSIPNAGKGGLENRVQVVSEISRGLKVMAKELNVPVICLSQLSRAVENRADKRPILADLRESGSIEQDADSVLALYRDDYYNKDTPEPGVVECIVLKNRQGETGTIKLQWLGQYQLFSDKEWKHD